ncbi:hypothetical protein T10_9590 [Trichinella papuae]|uniref:Uncharacterized protein n=1 Tax=Trichinella papuae TaxID=268474 RepID=A0A0V1M1A5_9BILA|nr:hypothetical protein T10_9590 [Trichinella papuae]
MFDIPDISFTYGPTQDLMLSITFSPEFMQIC